MPSLVDLAFIGVVIFALIRQVLDTAKRRKQIKDRANRDFEADGEIPRGELDNRLSEMESMYEDLEQTYWAHISALVGIASYAHWHIWYISVSIFVALAIVGTQFLSLKPFTTGIAD